MSSRPVSGVVSERLRLRLRLRDAPQVRAGGPERVPVADRQTVRDERSKRRESRVVPALAPRLGDGGDGSERGVSRRCARTGAQERRRERVQVELQDARHRARVAHTSQRRVFALVVPGRALGDDAGVPGDAV
jgi:hypothetical protein